MWPTADVFQASSQTSPFGVTRNGTVKATWIFFYFLHELILLSFFRSYSCLELRCAVHKMDEAQRSEPSQTTPVCQNAHGAVSFSDSRNLSLGYAPKILLSICFEHQCAIISKATAPSFRCGLFALKHMLLSTNDIYRESPAACHDLLARCSLNERM
jgi:hypothetical protein